MRSSNHSTDSKRYLDWLYHARLDFLAAQLLRTDARCYNATAFHCQQAIEKALKGYMLFKVKRLFDGHNLSWLCKQAMLLDKSFAKWLGKSAMLGRYYIETRYPADIPLKIDADTIEELMLSTEEMLEHICTELRFDFKSYRKKVL